MDGDHPPKNSEIKGHAYLEGVSFSELEHDNVDVVLSAEFGFFYIKRGKIWGPIFFRTFRFAVLFPRNWFDFFAVSAGEWKGVIIEFWWNVIKPEHEIGSKGLDYQQHGTLFLSASDVVNSR